MKEKIRDIMFPRIEPEIQRDVDLESVKNIYYMSLAVVLFELFTFVAFVVTREEFDYDTWISICSVLYCTALCLVGVAFARNHLRKPLNSSHPIRPFRVLYSLMLSTWAVWVSYRHYLRGDQLTTFFAVILMQVCFLPMKPWVSTVSMMSVYAALYFMLYSIDRAANVNKLNFLVLACLSVVGMIVRYHSQVRMSEKNVQLEHANRHDILTGLRNRYALEEDAKRLTGKRVMAYMMDINYFKIFNDTYGHLVGDAVLRQTADQIRGLFPNCYCYRYGGDEFLVLNPGECTFSEDTYRFSMPDHASIQLEMSIGCAEGTPADHQQLFELIAEADAKLYEVKRRTHSPEFGGRERRRKL